MIYITEKYLFNAALRNVAIVISRKGFSDGACFAAKGCLKENGKMIGTAELHTYFPNFKAELGYTINPNYWGNGFALEASCAIIDWGFNDLNLKRIECCSYIENKQSQRVCEKLGLTYEGIRKKGYQLYDGSIHDLICYSITDDEYYQK